MTRKKNTFQLTPLELQIMQVLWEQGPMTVQEVQQALGAKKKLAYTTVQTMLNLLFRKKKVKRVLKNRAYVYHPIVSHEEAARYAVDDMIDRMFGGSAENLVMSLVESDHLSPDDLKKLQRLIDEKAKP